MIVCWGVLERNRNRRGENTQEDQVNMYADTCVCERKRKRQSKGKKRENLGLCIYPTPPSLRECNTNQILMTLKLVWIECFPSSILSSQPKRKNPIYLTTTRVGKQIESCLF